MCTGLLLATGICLSLGCGSAGQYGHSRTYTPLGPESDLAAQAKQYDPVMAQRQPAKWRGQLVSVFGVVTKRYKDANGVTKLVLSVRILEPRNLCESAEEDSCRVTVSEKMHGRIHALLELQPDDQRGEHSLGPRSLVRVIGKLSDAKDGLPLLTAQYYRHWPRDFYVTTKAREYMRR